MEQCGGKRRAQREGARGVRGKGGRERIHNCVATSWMGGSKGVIDFVHCGSDLRRTEELVAEDM